MVAGICSPAQNDALTWLLFASTQTTERVSWPPPHDALHAEKLPSNHE